MIQVDETGIRKMVEGLKSTETEASVCFGKDGLLLHVSCGNLEESTIEKINNSIPMWNLTNIHPNYEARKTEFTYTLPYSSLSVTSVLKDAIVSTYKEAKKGIRGSGIPIAKCPVCLKPGKLKVSNGYISVYHAANGKAKPEYHGVTRYIEGLGMDADEIKKKLIKAINGEIKIENFVPTSGNMVIVEGTGKEKLTSQDMGYYLKKLRESN